MASDNLQAKYLAKTTSSVCQNVLGLFSAANHVHDPQNRFNRRQMLSYTQWRCEDYIGQLHVSKVELTQAHKDILEMLFTHFPVRNISIVKDMPEQLVNFSFDQLLRKLGKASNPNNYCWLLNALDDLRSVSITLTLIDSRPNQNGKVRFEAEEFSVLNSIKIGGEYFPCLKSKESTDTYLSKHTSFVDCELNFSRQFSNLLKKDILLEYSALVPEIVKLPQGFMKALVRHCYGHEWKKGAPFDELLKTYLQFHHDAKSRTLQKELCNARKFFKPNEDGTESEWTKHFHDMFGIDLYWVNSKLFVSWNKKEFDAANKAETDKGLKLRRFSQWEEEPKASKVKALAKFAKNKIKTTEFKPRAVKTADQKELEELEQKRAQRTKELVIMMKNENRTRLPPSAEREIDALDKKIDALKKVK